MDYETDPVLMREGEVAKCLSNVELITAGTAQGEEASGEYQPRSLAKRGQGTIEHDALSQNW